jgi:hypothetical protein
MIMVSKPWWRAIPAMYAQSLGCSSSEMLFCLSLVLKITWILLLEYVCDMVPSLRDLLGSTPLPSAETLG